jgi:hypothetical protein
MNDMRGIEFDVNGGGVHFVPPLQGGGELFMDIYLGLGAERLTPGCHMTGFQPLRVGGSISDSVGLKAPNVIAWAEGPGNPSRQTSQAL